MSITEEENKIEGEVKDNLGTKTTQSIDRSMQKQSTSDSYRCNDDGIQPYDVLCGQNNQALKNVGNRRFRITVSFSVDRYLAASTKIGKANVITSVLERVRANGGRFLRKQKDEWVELDDKTAREKIGHALRRMAGERERDGAKGYAVESTLFAQRQARRESYSSQEIYCGQELDERSASEDHVAIQRSEREKPIIHYNSSGSEGNRSVCPASLEATYCESACLPHGPSDECSRGEIPDEIPTPCQQKLVDHDSQNNLFLELWQNEMDFSSSSDEGSLSEGGS